jgi:hypothetical protein
MPPDRWSEIEKLYHSVLAREPADRIAFLNGICTDEQLKGEVESLLEHQHKGDLLLENRPWQSGAAVGIGTQVGSYRLELPSEKAEWVWCTARSTPS